MKLTCPFYVTEFRNHPKTKQTVTSWASWRESWNDKFSCYRNISCHFISFKHLNTVCFVFIWPDLLNLKEIKRSAETKMEWFGCFYNNSCLTCFALYYGGELWTYLSVGFERHFVFKCIRLFGSFILFKTL